MVSSDAAGSMLGAAPRPVAGLGTALAVIDAVELVGGIWRLTITTTTIAATAMASATPDHFKARDGLPDAEGEMAVGLFLAIADATKSTGAASCAAATASRNASALATSWTSAPDFDSRS